MTNPAQAQKPDANKTPEEKTKLEEANKTGQNPNKPASSSDKK